MTKQQLDERWSIIGHPLLEEEYLKYLEISYSLVSGPLIAAIDASMEPASIFTLIVEIMTNHCNLTLSAKIGQAEASPKTNLKKGSSINFHEETNLAGSEYNGLIEEEIVLDDVFDTENTNISNFRASSTRGYNTKKLRSRRSSLGVFGAISEMKMEW